MLSRARRPRRAKPRGPSKAAISLPAPASGVVSCSTVSRTHPHKAPSAAAALVKSVVRRDQQPQYFDVTTSGYFTVSDSGGIAFLNIVPQFTAAGGTVPLPSERLGYRILQEKLDLRFVAACPGGLTGDLFNVLRCIVGWWADNEGGAPSIANILEYTGPAGVTSPYAYDNMLNRRGSGPKLRILYDETFALSASGPTVLSSSVVIPLDDHATNFNNQPSVPTSVVGDLLFIAYISDSASPPDANAAYTARLVFRNAQ
jgi:hypothetical protein